MEFIKNNIRYILALVTISTIVFVFYILLGLQSDQNRFLSLEPMMDGIGPRPFVYRVLTPFIVRVISMAFNIPPLFGALIVMYLSLLGFALTMPSLIKIFLPEGNFLKPSLMAPLGLVPFLLVHRQVYDFPTLFLFTLALFFLAKKNFRGYLPVFIFAVLSKETSLFLLFFFLLQFNGMERKRFIFLAAVQLVFYALIRLALIYVFRDNPGSVVEFHLYEHMGVYLHYWLAALALLASAIGIIYICIMIPLDEANFIRNSIIAIGGPTLILYFFLGMPFEIRIFLEAYPSIFLAVLLAVRFSLGHTEESEQLIQ